MKPDDRTLKRRSIWAPAKPTAVFDTYWRFAAERQEIFFRRLRGDRQPWTHDPILLKHKFTNAYRASDRTSQYLIKNVIYDRHDRECDDIFFRIMLFKIFNKIETWQLLEKRFGDITWRNFNYRYYDRVLSGERQRRRAIYSAAYIMPSGGQKLGHSAKHRNHLKLICMMMADGLPSRVESARNMQHVFDLFLSYPTIGPFLAYQYATDINYSPITNFSEKSFVVPGPGARDGLRKCFLDYGGLSEVDLIKRVADLQEGEFERLGISFRSLWGRPLQLIDCQNCFCEVDKYARVAHPEVKGITGRTRIKQVFTPKSGAIEYFYPPKWGINDAVQTDLTAARDCRDVKTGKDPWGRP